MPLDAQRREPVAYTENADFERRDALNNPVIPSGQGVAVVSAGVNSNNKVITHRISGDNELLVELQPVEERLGDVNDYIVTYPPGYPDVPLGNYGVIPILKGVLEYGVRIYNWLANSLGAVIDNGRIKIIESVSAAGNLSVTTAAIGTNWTAFANQQCNRVHVLNTTGVSIEVRQGGAGVGLVMPTNTGFTFNATSNANELSIRRVDLSNTQVTVFARWEE